MSAKWILFLGILLFLLAYKIYAGYLSKSWGVDENRSTPAYTEEDGIDYVPAKYPVLLGHHFSSIAGAGPIVGPIVAIMFGWLPALLWIIIGCIFFGGVHDMGSIFISIRNKGKSIGEVIGTTIGRKGKKLFQLFAYLTLILVVAAFLNIVADTFVSTPQAATISIIFMFLSVAFGYVVYKMKKSLAICSVIWLIFIVIAIYIGNLYPIRMGKTFWLLFLNLYIFIASVTPVWILLQPRDYLNSFLLYGVMIGGILGVIIADPKLNMPAVTAFNVHGNYLFPMLFITVACGAISGFHSLVASGTTSKQLDNEKNVRIIGYGSMLIEGVLAIIAVITAVYLTQDKYKELMAGGPINVFSNGLGNFMNSFGVSIEAGRNFTALAISAFALTSLDTATRLARFLFQEFLSDMKNGKNDKVIDSFTSKYIATFITVAIGAILGFKGYIYIWPIFASANQLLSALALLALSVWLKKQSKNYIITAIPMACMFLITLTALILLIIANLKNYMLLSIAVLLFILALVLLQQAKISLNQKIDIE